MDTSVRNGVALLGKAIASSDSLVCCGLDPDLSRFPSEVILTCLTAEEKALFFLRAVVEATAPFVCAYKIQKAFFDAFADGYLALRDIVGYIKVRHPQIPVFLDCKAGDIDNTMDVYVRIAFELLDVDGMVVNPVHG